MVLDDPDRTASTATELMESSHSYLDLSSVGSEFLRTRDSTDSTDSGQRTPAQRFGIQGPEDGVASVGSAEQSSEDMEVDMVGGMSGALQVRPCLYSDVKLSRAVLISALSHLTGRPERAGRRPAAPQRAQPQGCVPTLLAALVCNGHR